MMRKAITEVSLSRLKPSSLQVIIKMVLLSRLYPAAFGRHLSRYKTNARRPPGRRPSCAPFLRTIIGSCEVGGPRHAFLFLALLRITIHLSVLRIERRH